MKRKNPRNTCSYTGLLGAMVSFCTLFSEKATQNETNEISASAKHPKAFSIFWKHDPIPPKTSASQTWNILPQHNSYFNCSFFYFDCCALNNCKIYFRLCKYCSLHEANAFGIRNLQQKFFWNTSLFCVWNTSKTLWGAEAHSIKDTYFPLACRTYIALHHHLHLCETFFNTNDNSTKDYIHWSSIV